MQLHNKHEPSATVSNNEPPIHWFVEPQLQAWIEAWPLDVPWRPGDPNEPLDPSDGVIPVSASALPDLHIYQSEYSRDPLQSDLPIYGQSPADGVDLSSYGFSLDADGNLARSYSGMKVVYTGLPERNRIPEGQGGGKETEERYTVPASSHEDETDFLSVRRVGSRQGGTSSRGYTKSVSVAIARSNAAQDDLFQRDCEEEYSADIRSFVK